MPDEGLVVIGPFDLTVNAAEAAAFSRSIGLRASPSLLFPMTALLRNPDIRAAIAAFIGSRLPVQTSQSIEMSQPLVAGKTYRLTARLLPVLQKIRPVISVEAEIEADGVLHGRVTASLALVETGASA